MNTATPPFASTIHRADSAIHCFGPTAGEIRLNVRMAGEATEDEVCQNLRLAIKQVLSERLTGWKSNSMSGWKIF